MRTYTGVKDLGNLHDVVKEALDIKKNRFAYKTTGENKTLLMVFFNAALNTRLSTKKAATNLGMNTIILDFNQGAWHVETEDGSVMDGDKPEHIREAIPVLGAFCDIIGVRTPSLLTNREDDYADYLLHRFIQLSGRPVFNMESAVAHPLQALADLITIEEFKKKARPKVVLSWAPHPRVLSQAAPNSFADFMNEADVDFVITHPEGYELAPQFARNARVEYNQESAFRNADFIYAKNWSPYNESDYGTAPNKDMGWTVDKRKMSLTDSAYFMHCLPVRRNVVVTDEVIDSPQSIVLQQAANREIATQLVLKRMLEGL